MSGVNKAVVLGNLGQDPEVRTTQSGSKICTLSIATSEQWKDKTTGEKKERTEWHRVVIFNEPLVNVAEKYLKKGSKVYIEGMMQTRKWTDKNGVDRYTTEIVLKPFVGTLALVDSRGSGGVQPGGEDDYSTGTAAQPQQTLAQEMDDEIPF